MRFEGVGFGLMSGGTRGLVKNIIEVVSEPYTSTKNSLLVTRLK